MICIWKIEQDLLIIEQDEGRPFFRPRSMNEARLLAQKASAKMLEECVALNSRFTNLATINIHGGLAEGTLWHMDLGKQLALYDGVFLNIWVFFHAAVANLDDGARKRWSVMLGKPLTLAGKLLNFANGGEIVSYLDGARDLVLGERGELRQPGEANQPGPQVTRDTDQLSVILADSEFDGNIDPIAQDPRNAIDWTTWFHDRGLDDAVNEYIATTVLEYFALPPAGDGPPQGDLVDATIMFVGLSELVPTTDAFNSESMQTFMDDNLPRINEAYEICLRNACTRETFSDHENEERVYQGDIVNFLFDDKGCSFIARFPDHLPLKQALRIKNDLRANHTPSKAAITYGNTFYGFSGAQNHRYTFTTLSVHTNDAARLCYSPRLVLEENTIAIDDAVARKLTNNERSYGLAGAIKRGATPRKRAIKKVNQFKSKGTRSEVYHFYSLNVWHYLRSFHENLELERTPTLAHVFSWRIIEAQSHNLERFEYGHMLDAPEREEQEPAPGVLEGIFAFFQGFIQELG